ncbi:MAG: T9SS type A sorting domain-containing protein [Bacteroidia bacterium]|nr:T9SS type A sorting domain-containing protein [Bacteroidia bacterium]
MPKELAINTWDVLDGSSCTAPYVQMDGTTFCCTYNTPGTYNLHYFKAQYTDPDYLQLDYILSSPTVTVIVTPGPANCSIPLNYDIPNGTDASTAFGGLTTITNANIRINGVLFVNQNLSFSGCNVIMGTDAKIIVQNTFGLSIINKSHLYSCCKMWDGIIVENGGSVRIESSSVIEDAKKAVLVQQGASGVVDVAIFNKNHTGIEFSTNTTTPNFSITRTLFTCRDIPLSTTPSSNPSLNSIWTNINTYTPTICKHNNTTTISEKSVYGIYATDVAGLNIGIDYLANYQNAFDQLKCGINLIRTNAVVYNNVFQNLLSTTCFLCTNIYGIGIRTAGTATGNYTVTIGGSGTIYQPNSFSNCYRAMELNDYKTYTVKNNAITNSSTSTGINYGNVGLLIKPANGNTITVSENTVTNCNNAVWINRSTTGNINSQEIIIENNTITSNASGFCTNGVNFSDVSNTGSTTPVDKIKIQYNTITQAYNCVTATNVKNSLVIRSNTQLQVKNNGTAVNAIKISNCKGVKIHDNQNINISPVYSPVNMTPVGFKGIFITGSTENQITCNKISNMGESMTFVGSCINSTLRNNALDKGNRGFVLRTNGEVGAQGTASLPCGLWWSSVTTDFTAHTYTENTTTANNLSKLFINSTGAPAGFTGIPSFNLGTGTPYSVGLGGINTATGSPISCGTIIIQMAPVGGAGTSAMSSTTTTNETTLLTSLATDESAYPVYGEEHQYSHKKYAFDKLEANGAINNATLQNFYDSVQVESMGKLKQVDNALKLNDAALASALNSSLFANNVVENNQKVFNALYLNYLNNNEYMFTQTEKDELLAIAEQCPFEGGNAVWQARVLYSTIENEWIEFIDNCDASVRQMTLENTPTTETIMDNRFKLYPNPNNGQMVLEYTIEKNEEAILNIYDIAGKLIRTDLINSNNKSIAINENSLDGGIYYYCISVKGKSVKSDKLIIIK